MINDNDNNINEILMKMKKEMIMKKMMWNNDN